MSDIISFVKMHGLGNDFVIINQADLPSHFILSDLAKLIADRYTGIGADQFILYKKYPNYYEMNIYNHDGSHAKACGNASRCLGKLMNLYFKEKNITLKVIDREINCHIEDDNQVSVNMGQVSFYENWMPSSERIWAIAERYGVELKETICADIGNPHLVIFSNLSDPDKEIIGKQLQTNELFPEGINVNFAEVVNDKINLKVWERGIGFTLACGSGACASFAAARKLGFVREESEVVFKLGSLKMKQNEENIIMKGPATLVARGEFYYE